MTDLLPELADLLHDYRDDWQIERQEHPAAWVAIRRPTLTRIHVLVAQALPNLVYSDGLRWQRYKYGESASESVRLTGGFTSDSGQLRAVDGRFMGLISDFLLWPQRYAQPHAPGWP